MRPAFVIAIVITWLAASAARADDWLLYAPECSFGPETGELGRMALLYPRPFLPAIVGAGEPLIVRVRVPSALTPPPGIQRERALYGWSASIDGDGVVLDDRAEHRYRLRVADVRPDGPTSMIYRATLPIPRYAAPGTYSIRITAPGGSDSMRAAVRIVDPDQPLRVGRIGALDRDARAGLAVLARLPVDVWLVAPSPALIGLFEGASPGLPVMLGVGQGAASVLIELDGANALGACGPFFDEASQAFAEAAGVDRRALEIALPAPSLYAIESETRPLPRGDEVTIVREGSTLRVSTTLAPIEIGVVYPERPAGERDRAYAIDSDVAFVAKPATQIVYAHARPSIVARSIVQSSARFAMIETDAALLEVDAEPSPVPSGRVVTLTARAADGALIAWQLDEDVSAIGSTVRQRLRHAGRHRVPVVAIAPSGAAGRVEVELRFEPAIMHGCTVGRAARDVLPLQALLLLSLAAVRWLARCTRWFSSRSR